MEEAAGTPKHMVWYGSLSPVTSVSFLMARYTSTTNHSILNDLFRDKSFNFECGRKSQTKLQKSTRKRPSIGNQRPHPMDPLCGSMHCCLLKTPSVLSLRPRSQKLCGPSGHHHLQLQLLTWPPAPGVCRFYIAPAWLTRPAMVRRRARFGTTELSTKPLPPSQLGLPPFDGLRENSSSLVACTFRNMSDRGALKGRQPLRRDVWQFD